MTLREIIKDYMKATSFHGIRFIVEEENNLLEKAFWIICVAFSWVASGLLIAASLDAFQNNAISFVVESSYRDWDTQFPTIVVCESRNMDRIQQIAERLWGLEHDFTLEEVLSEIAYFRGESYHTIHECGGQHPPEGCIKNNFSYYAELVRSNCIETLDDCYWNDQKFDCCSYFLKMETEVGVCYGLNSKQISVDPPKDVPSINFVSNKYTGPGKLKINILTEGSIYILGEEDVPHLVANKADVLNVVPYISYNRLVSVKNIENDPLTRDVSVDQRNCRFTDENILDVHNHYSYSACSVQCRKDRQLKMCNCTSHLMPNTNPSEYCDMDGLKCLNDNYEDLSVVKASWSHNRRGVVCDCLPSCTETDISIVHDSRENIFGHQLPMSWVTIGMAALPTERYKRNVIRGKLDLVVSMGGTTGLFVGASLLSFVEIFYYFTVRIYGTYYMKKQKEEPQELTTLIK